jgi:hypothetical protein
MELLDLTLPVQVRTEEINGYQKKGNGNDNTKNRKYGKSADQQSQRKRKQYHSNAELRKFFIKT